MKYAELVSLYEKLESTPKRLEKTYYLSEFLKKTPTNDLSTTLLLLQGRVFPDWDERNIGIAARLVLKALYTTTGISVEDLEKRWKKIGDLGKVAEEVVAKKKQATLCSYELTAAKVFTNIQKLALVEGTGAVDVKMKLISELLSSAKPLEAKYVVRTLLEDLRIGVGEGVLRDAILWSVFPPIEGVYVQPEGAVEEKSVSSKKAVNVKKPEELLEIDFKHAGVLYGDTPQASRELYNYSVGLIQHAYDLTSDFAEVLTLLREKGLKGLLHVKIALFKPLRMMLYEKAKDITEAFEKVGKPAAFEYKYDGFRLEIHKKDDKIKLFTRNFEDVTPQFPDVVAVVRKHVKADEVILDSETVGYNTKTTQYLPFQSISQRIKRKYNITELATQFPVEVNVFDVLFYRGKQMLDVPFHERRAVLNKIIDPVDRKIVLSRIMITDKEEEARKFYDQALDKGNEGVMVKNLEAVYQPGKRVGFGVKVKPVMESLDLVIVGAEWGTGKRATWLTSFEVACRDEDGQLLEIGRVSTGVKELESEGVTYEYITQLLKPLIVEERGKVVTVKPNVVIEVHYEEIQKSPTYSSGYALRFPRFLRLREDRGVRDCSSIEQVEELYREQRGRGK